MYTARRFSSILLALCLLAPIVLARAPAQAQDMAKSLVEVPIAAAPSFRKRALVIGVEKYELPIPSLTACDDDARAFSKYLQEKMGFPPESIKLLTDDAANEGLRPTRSHLVKWIKAFVESVQPEDEVVFFFSGHGVHAGDQDWLVPMDGFAGDVEQTCISYSSLRNKLEAMSPRRALLITDACRNLVGGKGAGGGSEFGEAAGSKLRQFVEIRSCEPRQVSHEMEDQPAGVFTHFLLQGLEGDPEATLAIPEGRVLTFKSLMEFVSGKVSQYVANRFGSSQTPIGTAQIGADSMVLASFGVLAPPLARPGADPNSRGLALYKQHQYAQAEPLLREAVRLDPSNAQYLSDLGWNLSDNHKDAQAEPFLRQAVRLDPARAEHQSRLGAILASQKKYAEAMPFLREAVRLDPKGAEWKSHLGIALYLHREEAEGMLLLREAVQFDPANAKCQGMLGVILLMRQEFAEAEPFLREAMRLDPADADCKSLLGYALVKQNKEAEGMSLLREAVRLDPSDASAHRSLGEALAQQDKFFEAEPFFRAAVRLAPSNVMHRLLLALVLTAQKKNGQAKQVFLEAEQVAREAVRLNPSSAEDQFALGFAFAMQDKHAQAVPFLREAVRLDPLNFLYQETLKKSLGT